MAEVHAWLSYGQGTFRRHHLIKTPLAPIPRWRRHSSSPCGRARTALRVSSSLTEASPEALTNAVSGAVDPLLSDSFSGPRMEPANLYPARPPFLADGIPLQISSGHIPSFLLHILPSLLMCLLPGPAMASAGSIGNSSFGQKVAVLLRSSGWPDAAIILFISALPIVELRGAIPVGFWMGMDQRTAAALAVAGNMLPVPFILLFLGPLTRFLTSSSSSPVSRFVSWFLEYTRKKAAPIAEFRSLGLALFVGVPLPGTGAWSGAIGAHLLGMPFWESMAANLVGVLLACLIVNRLCVLGIQQAALLGAVLFIGSSGLWGLLRFVLKGRNGDETEERSQEQQEQRHGNEHDGK